jgi:hypothetical protein
VPREPVLLCRLHLAGLIFSSHPGGAAAGAGMRGQRKLSRSSCSLPNQPMASCSSGCRFAPCLASGTRPTRRGPAWPGGRFAVGQLRRRDFPVRFPVPRPVLAGVRLRGVHRAGRGRRESPTRLGTTAGPVTGGRARRARPVAGSRLRRGGPPSAKYGGGAGRHWPRRRSRLTIMCV